MKYTLLNSLDYLLLILLTLGFFTVPAQPVPFEGANVILITTDLADKEAYLTIGQILSEHGIPYSADNNCLILSGPLKGEEARKIHEFTGRLSVNSGLVKLTGSMHTSTGSNGTQLTKLITMPVGYSKDKRKDALSREGFLYLNDIAKKLHRALHGVISYKVQPQETE